MDIRCKYTVSEISLKLGLSASWVNKINRKIGITTTLGSEYKRVYFRDEDLCIFRNIKLLRVLGYSISEIKKIYDIEKKMLSCKAINSKYKSEAPRQGYHYILHPYNFTYDERVHPGQDMKDYDIEIIDYKGWAEFIYMTSVGIEKRSQQLESELGDFIVTITKDVEAGNKLSPYTK